MKKYQLQIILICIISLLFTACQAAQDPTEGSGTSGEISDSEYLSGKEDETSDTRDPSDTSDTSNVEDTTETDETSDTEDTSVEDTEEPLTLESLILSHMCRAGCPEAILTTFANNYVGGDVIDSLESWLADKDVQAFLASNYSDYAFFTSDDVRLWEVLYATKSTSLRNYPEERDALAKIHPYGEDVDELPARRLTASELEAMVMKGLGIPMSQAMTDGITAKDKTGIQHAYYIAEYDVYYILASDTNVYPDPCILRSYQMTDGRYLLLLHSGADEGFRIVLCAATESSFRFDAMIVVEDLFS